MAALHLSANRRSAVDVVEIELPGATLTPILINRHISGFLGMAAKLGSARQERAFPNGGGAGGFQHVRGNVSAVFGKKPQPGFVGLRIDPIRGWEAPA